MAYRGYFSLDGVEIVNSARVVAHLGAETPTNDNIFHPGLVDCSLTETTPGSGLYTLPAAATDATPGLAVPLDGSRIYSPGLIQVGDCWTGANLCGACASSVAYDDSWTGLKAFLGDTVYRPELAPWYSSQIPESGEFGGVWVLDVDGFGPTPVTRPVTELVGDGAAAGRHRDTSRVLTFDALLIACSNAGLVYGIEWLACQLRETKARSDATLRYLSAHPGGSTADPDTLVRELHNVVLTKTVTVDDVFAPGAAQNREATMYRVSWELTVLHPYAYTPAVTVPVTWDTVIPQPIIWVHAAECAAPAYCDPMPMLFSTECHPEAVEIVTTPPPSCGGCLPVCEVDTYVFEVPLFTSPLQCRETAVTTVIRNDSQYPLTLQAYWRVCDADAACDDNRWPLQVAGLPGYTTLILDGITGRYRAEFEKRHYRAVGIVSTPNGAPWQPPVISRGDCWELVVLAPSSAYFTVNLILADRAS